MLAYLKKFIKRFEPLLNPCLPDRQASLEKGRRYGVSFYLVSANILLVFFLILLSNVGVLPFEKIGDFGFFAVIFLILALYRPGWAFLFFIGTIVLENINLAPESLGLAIRPYQFIGALTILAALIRLISKRLNFSLPKWNWSDAAVLVFVAAGFISFFVGVVHEPPLQEVIIASFAALYFLTKLFIQNLEDIKKVLPFFLSSSFIIIIYGIWQNARFMKGLESFETMPGRPNATFAEADWLGMFLVLILAVVYSLIFYFYRRRNKTEFKNFNSQSLVSNKITNYKLQITKIFLYLLLTVCYLLLILTVSRSAWLGAITVSIMYFVLCIMYFFRRNNKKILWIPAFAGMTFIIAFGIIYIFNLTNFELENRLQSAGSGLQEITVSCLETRHASSLPKIIQDISELSQYNCRHIDLEEIEAEKAQGNFITRVKRNDPNVNIRAEIYLKSWKQIKKHPILGIGWGNISQVLGTDERGAGLNSSNIFLEVWLGSGLIGIISFVFILGNIIIRTIQNLKLENQSRNSSLKTEEFNENKAWSLFLALGLFAILIPNLFNAGIMLGFLWVWLAVANIKS